MRVSIGLGLVVLACLAFSFLFSGMEAGVLALSRFRVRWQNRTGVRRAQFLNEYLERPEDFLWTILTGNTLAVFGAFTLIVIGLFELFDGHFGWVWGTFAVVVFLFFAFCDLLPKMLFRQFPNRLCLALAVPFRFVHLALAPLVAVLTWFSDILLRLTGRKRFQGQIFSSRREVRLALQESAQILTSEERTMVNRVLDLQDLTIRSIAVPLSRVVGVTFQTPISQVLEMGRQQPVNRLPVWDREGPGRRIVGIISLDFFLYSDAWQPEQPAGRFSRPPLHLREDVRLEEALRRMQRARQRMAVVIGFDQREVGVASLHDILKCIFGEVTL